MNVSERLGWNSCVLDAHTREVSTFHAQATHLCMHVHVAYWPMAVAWEMDTPPCMCVQDARIPARHCARTHTEGIHVPRHSMGQYATCTCMHNVSGLWRGNVDTSVCVRPGARISSQDAALILCHRLAFESESVIHIINSRRLGALRATHDNR